MEGQQEQQPRTPADQQPAAATPEQRFKTLGVRIEEGLHARLSFIAQLEGITIADEIRRSIETRVQAAQDDPELVARAEAVNAEMERQAQARRTAIAGFFGPTAVAGSVEQPATAPATNGRRRAAVKSAGQQAQP